MRVYVYHHLCRQGHHLNYYLYGRVCVIQYACSCVMHIRIVCVFLYVWMDSWTTIVNYRWTTIQAVYMLYTSIQLINLTASREVTLHVCVCALLMNMHVYIYVHKQSHISLLHAPS